MRVLTNRCAFAGLFIMLLTAAAGGKEGAGEARVQVVSSLGKLTSALPDEDFLAQYETSPVIHAARGESEALQLLVTAPAGGLRGLTAQPGPFKHISGDTWDAGELSARFVGFVTTKEPYYGTLHVGLWADPLLADSKKDIPGGQWRAVWVEVSVPPKCKAGRYAGEIKLAAEGWSAAVPMEVLVWDFELPASPSLPSSFMLYPRYVYERYGLEKGSPEADAIIQRMHESMLAHRIMPTYVVNDIPSRRARLRIDRTGALESADFSAFDAQVAWALARGQSRFGLEGPGEIGPESEGWYRAMADHLREQGLLDRFYTYLADETYEGVAELTAMAHRAAPDLTNLITQMPAEGFPDVDRWCPRLGDASMRTREIEAWMRAKGMRRDRFWTYTAGNAGSDVPALHLDVPGIEARMTPLAAWLGGYGGFLFWGVNYWTVDPREDPMVYPRQNGNGSLYYPDRAGPLESLRLKLLRDGFDDVDYAQMLFAKEDVLAKRIFKALPMRSPLDWERDARALEAWRLAAGHYLGGDKVLAESCVERIESGRESEVTAGRAVTSLDKPNKGWHGARDCETVTGPDGRRALRFTLDAGKWKLWRLPSPRNWQGHGEVLMEIKLVEGEPVILSFKLASGLIKRHSWSWELHMAPGEPRRVRIPIPHERVNTGSLTELALFVWEPESARRFEISGIWIE